MGRDESGLTAEERAERDRILAAYPLSDFTAAMQPSNPIFWDNDTIATETRCARERDAGLEGLGLHGEAD